MALTIRDRHSGAILAGGDSDENVRVFEGNWYFAPEAVDTTYLELTERTYNCPYKGVCYWYDLKDEHGTVIMQNAAWVYDNPLPGYEMIKGRIAFYSRDTSGTSAETHAPPARL